MTTIAIVGVGLIGGSLALCFKGQPGMRVVGYSPRASSVRKYMERGVVDHATTSLKEAAEAADILFLCVPVGRLEAYLLELGQLQLRPGCIITDVGSTKASVSACAARLELGEACFIGGHPMAGSERSGVEAASAHLFENAYYVLTPQPDAPESAVERLTALLRLTKAHIVRMDAGVHDEVVGAISHLPHMIAAALVNQVRGYHAQDPIYGSLAAGGFRDITRIASADPVVWRDILLNNKQVLLRLLGDWNHEVASFARMLEQDDAEAIEASFRSAGEFRGQLPERRKGMIHSLYECYVDVPDHPGIIGSITTELGKHRVNLSNIQIIESREDVPGVLRLSFREQQDLDAATQLLESSGYAVHF
ncbi:prephenate dehydrogenase [Paenibacillus sabuli]|nr:prephenate dehydrogenase [Paenibacillus sabuli]